MHSEVTSRNHQAYSWGHLVRDSTLTSIVLVYGFANLVIILPKTLDLAVFRKIGKTWPSACNRKGIPDLWILVQNCEFFTLVRQRIFLSFV